FQGGDTGPGLPLGGARHARNVGPGLRFLGGRQGVFARGTQVERKGAGRRYGMTVRTRHARHGVAVTLSRLPEPEQGSVHVSRPSRGAHAELDEFYARFSLRKSQNCSRGQKYANDSLHTNGTSHEVRRVSAEPTATLQRPSV